MRTAHEMRTELDGLVKERDRLGDELTGVQAKLADDPNNTGLKTRSDNLIRGLKNIGDKAKALEAEYSAAMLKGFEAGEYGTEAGDGATRTPAGTVKAAGDGTAREWATAVADKLTKAANGAGIKALTTGSIDVPSLIRTAPIALPTNPARLIDLLVDRERLTDGNAFEFLRQTVRTNNAAPVADLATKPTSVFTLAPIEDRARVVAHLSEPVPERYFTDHANVVRFLEAEMFTGVVDALEAQLVSGDGTGENFTGILNTIGITAVAFATDVLTTVRKARTTLQNLNERPTAWAFNPTDAEAIDLLEETTGAYLVASGLANIFGDLPKIVSTSVPAGTALLGDWNQARLYVREDMRLDADRSGDNFKANQVVLRAEGRFGLAVLRPQAFAEVALTGP